MSDKKVVLKAKDLCKTFSNESVQQHVLKNLDLSIYKGDFTVIMGNSGSGKSTLLYSLSGMDRPTLGTVTYHVDGKDVEISKYSNDKLALFRRNYSGFVFQQNYLNDSMSALDNVMISGLLKNKDRKALAEKAKTLLGKVDRRAGLQKVSYPVIRRTAAESCSGKRSHQRAGGPVCRRAYRSS